MTATTVLRNFLVFLCFLVLTTGCFEEDNFIADNIEKTGEKYPVVADFSVASAQDTFAVGETARLDVRFWSEGTVASINLYDDVQDEQPVKSIDPSNAAFSEVSQTDSLIIEYTVPSSVTDTTFIDLDVEVENENGLTETNETANNFAISGVGVVGVP